MIKDLLTALMTIVTGGILLAFLVMLSLVMVPASWEMAAEAHNHDVQIAKYIERQCELKWPLGGDRYTDCVESWGE